MNGIKCLTFHHIALVKERFVDSVFVPYQMFLQDSARAIVRISYQFDRSYRRPMDAIFRPLFIEEIFQFSVTFGANMGESSLQIPRITYFVTFFHRGRT